MLIRSGLAGWRAALPSRLMRGGLGSGGVQLLYRGVQLALGILLARHLGAAGYGTYSFAIAVMGLLLVVAEAGVPTLVMREVARYRTLADWRRLRGVLTWALATVAAISLALGALGLVGLTMLAAQFEPASWYTQALMLTVLPLVACLKTLAHGLRGLEHPVIGQALGLLVRPLLALLLVAAALPLLGDIAAGHAMAAQLAAATIALTLAVAALWRRLPPAARSRPAYDTRAWFASALPFVLIGGANMINMQADLVILGLFRPAQEVGHYRVAVQGSLLVAFGLQALTPVVSPRLARHYNRGEPRRLQRLVRRASALMLLTALPVAITFAVAGRELIAWVFTAAYEPGYASLLILTVAQLVNVAAGPMGICLSMIDRAGINARLVVATALLNVALNGALIPIYGLEGAALATGASLVAKNVLQYVVGWRCLHALAPPAPSASGE